MPSCQGVSEGGVGRPLECVSNGIGRRDQSPSGIGLRERAVHTTEVLHGIDYLCRLRDDDALFLEKAEVEIDIPSDNLIRTVE